MTEQVDNPPDYDSLPPRRPDIQCIRTPSAPERKQISHRSPWLLPVTNATFLSTKRLPAQIASIPRAAQINESLASAEKMIRNIEAILKAAGSGLDRIIKTTVYFTENLWVHLIEGFEALYKRILPFAPPRTTVFVPRMGHKGNRQEIQMEVIAVE
ncbi:hypothetical protein N7527_000208 [Penicillium freii]|nr:hypothetical protein N7527_000208 [Penicillium freii]